MPCAAGYAPVVTLVVVGRVTEGSTPTARAYARAGSHEAAQMRRALRRNEVGPHPVPDHQDHALACEHAARWHHACLAASSGIGISLHVRT